MPVTVRNVPISTRGTQRTVRLATTSLAGDKESHKRTTEDGADLPRWVSPTSSRWSPPSTRSSPEFRARVVSPEVSHA